MVRIFFRGCGDSREQQHNCAYSLLASAASECGFDCSGIEIAKTERGKPYFVGRDDVGFSLSHSGAFAVCSIGKAPSGIDIQKRGTVSDKVADRFLGGARGEDADYLWTMRESFGKLTGNGFFFGESFPEGLVFSRFDDIDGYIITLCTYEGVASEFCGIL